MTKNKLLFFGLFSIVAAALPLLQAQPPKDSPKQPAQIGGGAKPANFTGSIKRDDPLDNKLKHPAKVHEFKMAKDQTYVIRLKSTDFDAFLIVRDSQKKELAFNDDDPDEPPTLNSKLVFTAPKEDLYQIIATSLDNKVGNYELRIEAASPEQVLAAKATQLAAEGEMLFQSRRFKEAEDKLSDLLEIRRRLYPKNRYPQGHVELANTLAWMGILLGAQNEYARAEPFYLDALTMYRALYPKTRYSEGHLANLLAHLGSLYESMSEYAKAEVYMREALSINQTLFPKEKYPQGHLTVATSLNNLGVLLKIQGEYVKAEPYYVDSLAMIRALYPRERFQQGHLDLALSLGNLGGLLVEQGDYAKAEPYFREALAMRRALYPKDQHPQGHPEVATTLGWLGYLLKYQGEYAKAEPHYREALAMCQALYPKDRYPQGHPEQATSLNNLGGLFLTQGDYAKAEPYYLEALAMRQALYPKDLYPQGHPKQATSLNNLGDLFLTQGDYAKAEPYYLEALAMRQALYPKNAYPNGHAEVATSLNSMGFLLEEQGNYTKAQSFYRDALAMIRAMYPKDRYPQGHPFLATCVNNLGGVLLKQGDYAKAEPYFRDALAMRQALYPKERYPQGHPDLVASLHNLGVLHAHKGDYPTAAAYWRDAVAMELLHFDRMAETAAEAQALNFAASLPQVCDGFLAVQRRLPEDAATYDLVWNWRAPLTRILQRRHLDMHASQDPAAKQMALELQSARQRLAHLLLSPPKDSAQHKKMLDDLTDIKEDLEKRLARQLALNQPVTAADNSPQRLSTAMPESTAFIDVVRITDFSQDPKVSGYKGIRRMARYLAFVLLSGKPALRVDLGEAEPIEKTWAAWRNAIVNNRSDHQAATALAGLIWEPLRQHIPTGTHTVWLAADGVLAQLPWAALPGARPNSILLEELAIAVVPHGAFLVQHLQDKPAALDAKAGVLTVGGVAYEKAPTGAPGFQELGIAPTDKLLRWDALPGTASEQEQITGLARKVFKTEPVILKDAQAGIAQVSAELSKVRFAHLATHGFFADAKFRSAFQVDEKQFLHLGTERKTAGARSPLVLSGLVLAGANRSETAQRGIMTAEAVVGLRLEDLELAVLSACETGLGETAGGEGVMGLQRAFHIAGARNVIASLWRVDDEATAALMALFYRNLWLESRPPLQALREAQLHIYRHPEQIKGLAQLRGIDFTAKDLPKVTPTPLAKDARAHTSQWAAFVLSGTGK